MRLGDYVADARHTAGLSRAELARKAGFAKNTLIAIEDGATTNPGLFTILALCRALHIAIPAPFGSLNAQKKTWRICT